MTTTKAASRSPWAKPDGKPSCFGSEQCPDGDAYEECRTEHPESHADCIKDGEWRTEKKRGTEAEDRPKKSKAPPASGRCPNYGHYQQDTKQCQTCCRWDKPSCADATDERREKEHAAEVLQMQEQRVQADQARKQSADPLTGSKARMALMDRAAKFRFGQPLAKVTILQRAELPPCCDGRYGMDAFCQECDRAAACRPTN
ncbi:MAG: hypothetical protein HQ592_18555 [Planctomycetes bacterium]|nr:hypothetical protein [Planctomycetota bacterium]